MSIARSTLETLCDDYAEGIGSDRWNETTIRRILTSVHQQEWSRILNASPRYRFGKRTVTTDAEGVVSLDDLNSGSGDSYERWYRILAVTDGDVAYQQVEFDEFPTAKTGSYGPSSPRSYYLVGNNIQILPDSGNLQLSIYVNHRPQLVSLLAGGDSIVEFPDGHELILAYRTAALMMMKGATESRPAAELIELANQERAQLLDDLARRTINPRTMAYPDGPSDWAGH